jgi:hypothetical protein
MAENKAPEGSNGDHASAITRNPVKFDPETLDRTLISLELLAVLRNAADNDVLDVIIDLNLEYPEGRDAARKWVARWLKSRFKQSAASAGSDDSRQQIQPAIRICRVNAREHPRAGR